MTRLPHSTKKQSYTHMKRPLILVSNDDSYMARGVHALIDRLTLLGDVVAVCPLHPQSGQSMAITVNSPLRITRIPLNR